MAFAALSSDFGSILNGQAPLSQAALDQMYAQFQTEFSSPSDKLSANRRAIFEDKVREIVAHNSNPNSTWMKGVNEYSDMTDEEFADYFHLKEEQHCSATVRPVASTNIE